MHGLCQGQSSNPYLLHSLLALSIFVVKILFYYRRLGFECEILLIANCEFYTKESQEKEYTVNNVTRDHTSFTCMLACDPKHARVIDVTCARSICMHVRKAVDRQE